MRTGLKAHLYYSQVSAFSTWDKELSKFVWFLILAAVSKRKTAFEEFIRDRAEEERREKNRLKEQREQFVKILEESRISHRLCVWSGVCISVLDVYVLIGICRWCSASLLVFIERMKGLKLLRRRGKEKPSFLSMWQISKSPPEREMDSTKSQPGAGQTRCVLYTLTTFSFKFLLLCSLCSFLALKITISFLLTSLFYLFVSLFPSLSTPSFYLLSLCIYCTQLKADFFAMLAEDKERNCEGGIRMAEGEGEVWSRLLISFYRQLVAMRETF